MNELDVWLSRSCAGRLSRSHQNYHFTYGQAATEALSLTMPLRVETYHYEQGLHPVFQMNMPEGYLRQALERYAAKQFGSDDLSYLVLLGQHQVGRLRYTAIHSELPQSNTLAPSLDALLTSDNALLFQQLFERYALHSGVAGVQPKFLLDAHESTQVDLGHKLTLPLKKYIVKSWGEEFPELACNEFFCLSLARSAGLTVPAHYLSDNGKLLVCERFDLNDKGEPLGFEDFCVLQGKTTQQKYDASLESCVNTLIHFVSPEQLTKSLMDFFKLTLLNSKIRNGDAHLKNIGVLYTSLDNYRQGEVPTAERTLAPVYDLVNTTAYLPNDSMALSLGGSKRWPKWKMLEKFGQTHCRLTRQQIDQAHQEINQACVLGLRDLDKIAATHTAFQPIAEVISEQLNCPM